MLTENVHFLSELLLDTLMFFDVFWTQGFAKEVSFRQLPFKRVHILLLPEYVEVA